MRNPRFVAFSKKWAIGTAVLWTLLAVALVVQTLRANAVQAGGMPSLFYQVGMVALGAVTACAWLFVSVARREFDVAVMGVVFVAITAWMVQSAFVERAVRTEAPALAPGLVGALMIAGMGIALLWQAQVFTRRSAATSNVAS